MRMDARLPEQLRPVSMIGHFTRTSGGSVLINWGGTRVLCTALLEQGTAPFLQDTGRGWLTAEYAMLPSSTSTRKKREGLKPDGRSTEIKRLIGRSLRAALDFEKLGDYSIWIDCDVLEADGGTRTASITGAWAALRLGVDRWLQQGILSVDPIIHQIAAVSVGIVEDEPRLDLCYQEDSSAQVDMNLVMDETGAFIEVQGTGEGRAFTRSEMNAMLSMGEAGIRSLFALQQQVVEESRL